MLLVSLNYEGLSEDIKNSIMIWLYRDFSLRSLIFTLKIVIFKKIHLNVLNETYQSIK